jgi:hypothetical protein
MSFSKIQNLDSASAVTKAILGRDKCLAYINQNFRAKLEFKIQNLGSASAVP